MNILALRFLRADDDDDDDDGSSSHHRNVSFYETTMLSVTEYPHLHSQ